VIDVRDINQDKFEAIRMIRWPQGAADRVCRLFHRRTGVPRLLAWQSGFQNQPPQCRIDQRLYFAACIS